MDFDKEYSKQIYVSIIIGFIILLWVEHVITLSTFVYNYNSHFYTGSMLKNVCDKSYTEYETNRFQLLNNENNLLLRNVPNNPHYTNVFKIIIGIVTFIYIILLFLSIYAKVYIDNLSTFEIDDVINSFLQQNIVAKLMYLGQFISILYLIALPSLNLGIVNAPFDEMTYTLVILISGLYFIYKGKLEISYASFVVILISLVIIKTLTTKARIQKQMSAEKLETDDNIFSKFLYDAFGFSQVENSDIMLLLIWVVVLLFVLALVYLLHYLLEN